MNSCFLLKRGQGSDKMTLILFRAYIRKVREQENANVYFRCTYPPSVVFLHATVQDG